MPDSDLRARLQRLRVHKGPRPAPSLPPRPAHGGSLPGEPVTTRLGTYQRIDQSFPLEHRHGPRPLADLLAQSPATAARLANDSALAEAGLDQLAFVDTETTGLAGGAGTLVFLVGVGLFHHRAFQLRQYFLPDPGDEAALLNDLVRDVSQAAGWITFNGRVFDLPLLETRLTLNGQRGALGRRPHLDLLTPARRLYRGRLPSCALGDIERHAFHIERDQADVPGALIPQLYLEYLRTRDPGEMRRVIYHNAMDILSMVTLAAQLLETFAAPLGPAARPEQGRKALLVSPADCLRLGTWHEAQARPADAEQAYRQALAGRLDLEDRRQALTRLALMLKRLGRRAEAAPLWEQLAAFTLDDIGPFVELAKFYEWHVPDLPRAIRWTERGLGVVAGWPRGWPRAEATTALQHRLKRLKEKTV